MVLIYSMFSFKPFKCSFKPILLLLKKRTVPIKRYLIPALAMVICKGISKYRRSATVLPSKLGVGSLIPRPSFEKSVITTEIEFSFLSSSCALMLQATRGELLTCFSLMLQQMLHLKLRGYSKPKQY